jgi:NCAIR mutase (PurE)-related protein
VFCQGKTPAQVATIMERLAARTDAVLGTRATPEVFAAVRAAMPAARYHELARTITVQRDEGRPRRAGVAVVSAGTSDLAVAEEAVVTAEVMGHAVDRIYDGCGGRAWSSWSPGWRARCPASWPGCWTCR